MYDYKISQWGHNYYSLLYTATTINLTAAVLAVIITVPSLFALMLLVALTATTIVLVHKRWTKQGTQAEAYYSTVGPPLPPAKLDYHTNAAAAPEIQPEENVAYSHTELVDTTENVAYGTNIAIAPDIQVEENLAYSCKPNDNPSGSAQDSQS